MSVPLSHDHLSRLIANIYDCAVDPTHWQNTLSEVRDVLDLAYFQLMFVDFSPTAHGERPNFVQYASAWDEHWLYSVVDLLPGVPGIDRWMQSDLDEPVTQYDLVPEAVFRETEFFRSWVQPQNLRDACMTQIARRETLTGGVFGVTRDSRDLLTGPERQVFRLLAPHFRRAVLIADMVDEGKLQLQLYRALLNQISAAVFMVDESCRIRHCNAAGDAILSGSGPLGEVSGRLWPMAAATRAPFQDAVRRACTQSDGDLGSWGNGIALPGADGAMAVAYVLPLGRSERRHALGPGQAAVFVTNRAGARPPSLEVLSALTGLTLAESRVALAVAGGHSTEVIADMQGISINTLRKHLANVYGKTGLNSQSGLAALVNQLRLPL